MSARLTPFGWLAKFLIVPVLAAGVGYWVVGPHVGKDFLRGKAPLLRHKVESALALADPKSHPAQATANPANPAPEQVQPEQKPPVADTTPSADVSVSVRPAREVEKFQPVRKYRRKRHKPKDTTVGGSEPDGGHGKGIIVVPPAQSPAPTETGG